MMLDVPEHVESDRVPDAPTQGACQVMRAVAMMMNGPDGEESGKTVAGHHRCNVIAEDGAARNPEDPRDPRGVHQQFPTHDSPQPSGSVAKRGRMQQDGKRRR